MVPGVALRSSPARQLAVCALDARKRHPVANGVDAGHGHECERIDAVLPQQDTTPGVPKRT